MKLKIFTVYDSKLEAYMTPFFMQKKGEALRAWHSTVNDASTSFAKYPGDYTLFEIGEFDDETGNFTSHESKINLGTALEHRAPEIPHYAQDGFKPELVNQ